MEPRTVKATMKSFPNSRAIAAVIFLISFSFLFFMSVVVFRAVCFLLFGFAVGDRLSENADDHGQKTEDAEDDGAGHGVPLLSFFGLVFPFCLLSNMRGPFGFIISKKIK